MEADEHSDAVTPTSEGLLIQENGGARLVSWMNVETLSLRDDSSISRPYKVVVSFLDSEGLFGPPSIRERVVDFETRTRRLLFVTRCRQLGAQAPCVGASRLYTAERPVRHLKGTTRKGSLEGSRKGHSLAARQRMDGVERPFQSLAADESQLGGVDSPQLQVGQSHFPVKASNQPYHPGLGRQWMPCYEAEQPAMTLADCWKYSGASGACLAHASGATKGTKLLSSTSSRERDPAVSSRICHSQGPEKRLLSSLRDSWSAEQNTGEQISHGYTAPHESLAGHLFQRVQQDVSDSLPSHPFSDSFSGLRLPQNQLQSSRLTLSEPSAIVEGSSMKLLKQNGRSGDSGDTNMRHVREMTQGSRSNIAEMKSREVHVEIPTRAPQRSRLGSAWTCIIRAGSKLFRGGRNQSRTSMASDSSPTEKDTARRSATSSAFFTPTSRRRQLSMPGHVVAVNKSCSSAVRSRHRGLLVNEVSGGSFSRASPVTPEEQTVPAAEVVAASESVCEASMPLPTKLDPFNSAASVSIPEDAFERTTIDERSSGYLGRTHVECDTEVAAWRSASRPKMCWKKPVMPLLRNAGPSAPLRTPTGDRRSSSAETSVASVVVVSRDSGESSPTFASREETKDSYSTDQGDMHQYPTGGYAPAVEAAELDEEVSSCSSVTTYPHVIVIPQFSSEQAATKPLQPVQFGSRKRDAREIHVDRYPPRRTLADHAATRHRKPSFSNGRMQLMALRGPHKPIKERLRCDAASRSESSDSEAEVVICQSTDKTAVLGKVLCGESTSCLTADKGELLVEEEAPSLCPPRIKISPVCAQAACDTVESCSVPDPVGQSDCPFTKAAVLGSSAHALDEARVAAREQEAPAAEQVGTGDDLIKGPFASTQSNSIPSTVTARHTDQWSISMDCTSSAAKQSNPPTSLREVFCQASSRVLVETDDEGDLSSFGRCSSRPHFASSFPSRSEQAAPDNSEGSLRRALADLWNDLEAAHRGNVELCRPVGTPLAPGPDVGTCELYPSPHETQVVCQPSSSPMFSKSAAHSTFKPTSIGARAATRRSASTLSSNPSRIPSGLPVTPQRKTTQDEFGSGWGLEEKDLEELIKEGEEDVPQLADGLAVPPSQLKSAHPGQSVPGTADKQALPTADHGVLEAGEQQRPADSASFVTELISRLKQNMREKAGSWWRESLMKVARRPLLASYETSTDFLSSTSEIQEELVPGPNENSIFSSNWHDRLQWTFQQVLTLRESQESKPSSQLRRSLFERELALSHEIGSFAAAARAAAVVLLHSLALEKRVCHAERSTQTSQEREARKGPAGCFIRITPEEYPTFWSVYQPKFARDEVYVFDSLVLTVIVGDPQANVKSYFAKEVYQNDIKGRQAMADAIYATCLARKNQTDLSLQSYSWRRHGHRNDLGQQVDTVWNTHGQFKFERAKLGLPIACLVDYAGLAVLVEPLLPLSPAPVNVLEELASDIRRCLPDFVRQCESIGNLLACFDALDKVDRATYNKFKNIARFLNLADYPFARGASDFQMSLPPVALWRSQVDHFCVFRNLHETLPPKCANGRVVPEQRFRQTFVSRVFDGTLPCTSREQYKAADASDSKFASRSTALRGSLEALEVAVHSLELAIKQDIVPVINGLQKNFLDSFDIAHTLHGHGINIRNIAELLNHGPACPFRDSIVREVVARSAKRLFRMQVETLSYGKLVETTHIEEIQRLVVTLFNLVLSKNEESRMFWLHQILPLALERYNVDLTELASPESVCTYSLFKAMEYNLGVHFDSRVVARSADGSGETVLELRLPLTVADLSTFSARRDSLLFPHVSHVRAVLLGSSQTEEQAGDAGAPGVQSPHLRSTKWRMRHFFETNDEDRQNEDGDALKAVSTIEELHTFAELRTVRGFYPKVHLVAPETFALMQAAISSTVVGASSTSLDVLLENMKAGLVVPASREEIWGSGNCALHGVCGAMRSALMGTGYPCHPYCLALDEDEKLQSVLLSVADNKSQCPLKQCLRYKRKKLGLTLALLLKAAIGNDILLLGKILQQTAYIMLQHNEVKAAASIADFIYSTIPDGLSLQSEAVLIDMQCTTKGTHPQDALMAYRNLKPALIAMEGKMSLRLLLADLLLASFAFKNKRFNAAILHGFRVYKISGVCFDTGGAHWAAIAALRLIARSMLEVQRCSEAIIILQRAVRAASTNPELPTLVTHMSRFWLAAAFARLGRLENASVEAQSMLAGLEAQLGTNHEATMSALYLAAEVKMRIGCLALQNPPLKIEESIEDNPTQDTGNIGAPGELQEPLLWKPLNADDFEVYEEIFRDKSMIQARADAEQLFLALFRRLLFREDNVLVDVYQPPGLERKQRLRQIFSTLKQILKLKLCSIPISVLRLLAHRIYVACVAQGCSPSLRPFGLMEQDQIARADESSETDSEEARDEGRAIRNLHLASDRTKVCFTRYPRLRVGWRSTSGTAKETIGDGQQGSPSAAHTTSREPQGDDADYPFSFYSQQKVSGTERRRAHGSEFLYASVDGSSGMRPPQEHDDVMLQLLLFCEGPPSLNGVLKSCYMSCLEDRGRNPSTWMDDIISDVLSERGSLQHLRFLVCMLRHLFTLSQKSLFIALAPGDFNRKSQAQFLIQTMSSQRVEGDVSRKLMLKRMVNKSREEVPDSTEDYFEYEINSPREFDLMVGIPRCEELLNSTTWTGSALRRMRSQLDFTLAKQSLTKHGSTDSWQYLAGDEDDFVEGTWNDADPCERAASGGTATSYRRGEITSVEENYLRIPFMGDGSISGKTTWKKMSTAARLAQLRFGGKNQFFVSASPAAYGVLNTVLPPQADSELEAFGCIECLQPAEKIPYLGG